MITLHSNLVIFQRCWQFQTSFRRLIFTFQSGYIPTIYPICSLDDMSVLYIPIWLYSNCKLRQPKIGNRPLHSNLVIFQRYQNQECANLSLSLHSNLVIFQPSDNVLSVRLVCPLHSNLVIFQLRNLIKRKILC